MEIPGVEGGEMALPINTTYGGSHGHGHGHNHTVPSSVQHQMQITNMPSMLVVPSSSSMEETTAYKMKNNNKMMSVVKYRECLKNHAASMGGNATDGCGEFMPSGEEGTIEALTCSACNCHRNFHRKEIEGDPHHSSCNYYTAPHLNRVSLGNGKNVIFQGHHQKGILGTESCLYNPNAGALVPSRALPPPPPLIMSYNMGMGIGSLPSESDEQEDGGGGGGFMSRHPPPQPPHQLVKKRFRTKFTQEQKDKMLNFAEKVGWKIQKQEECVVQQFCQEIGIKRRVLKVWMHNNKHNLAKKINSHVSSINPQSQINYENA